jgi:hypothetical protein
LNNGNNNNSNIGKDNNTLNKIKNFEKNLNKNFEYNYEKEHDSDIEKEQLEDEKFLYDPLTDKNQIVTRYKALQEKIEEKTQQIKLLQNKLEDTKKKQKEVLDAISKEQTTELKDKKLIELAKKNQDFKLQIEKYKLKEKDHEKKLNELSQEIQNLNIINLNSEKNSNLIHNNFNNNETEGNSAINIHELKKKQKASDAKIADIRNKLQLTKEENTKLNILIKREIGENIDLEKALKDKNYWKGRSEIIETLKTKIKILESQFSAGAWINPNISSSNLSIISEEGKNSNSNSNLNLNNLNLILPKSNLNNKSIISTVINPSLYQEYKREKEKLNSEIDKLKEENTKTTTDLNRVKIRKEALEKDVKQQKEDLTSKIKILLEKSDNDEKLILALNRELEKKGKGMFINPNDENSLFNLQQEILKLRNDIKEKESYINNINSMIMDGYGNSGNNQQNNLQNFSRMIIRSKELEDENKRFKAKSDDGKIYESLAKENAKLRLKVKELEDKLCER